MLFNTVTYAYFFTTVFVVTWALAPWRRARLAVILVASYFFYAGWTFVGFDKLAAASGPDFWQALFQSVKYLPLLFVATSVDFYLGVALDRIDEPRRRRAMLWATILVNVGILVFFKYWNWGADTFLWLFRDQLGYAVPDIHLKVDLPIGISFFCFMSLSYVVDVYRRTMPACRSYLTYLTYISFFPHLVAGPIIRGRDLLPHLERDTHLTAETGGEGLFLIAAGLFKKVVIGDYVAVNFVDRVFGEPSSYSAVEALMAMYGYAVQVYCDFSGYSDVAIGSALLLGYRFKINFDAPYKAVNVAEFWRRWHISLSTWLRDYVYIPLGGSKKGELRQQINIVTTMVVCGVWHGAAWAYVVFGFVQGFAVSASHWFKRLREDYPTVKAVAATAVGSLALWGLSIGLARYFGIPGLAILAHILLAGGWAVGLIIVLAERAFGEAAKLPLRVLCVAANFTFVAMSFTLFRAAYGGGSGLHKAGAMFERLATFTTYTPNLHPIVVAIMLGALVLQWTPRRLYDRAREAFIAAPAPVQAVALFLVAFTMRQAASAEAVPFVYFQF